mgnify:CR=1 FL=1
MGDEAHLVCAIVSHFLWLNQKCRLRSNKLCRSILRMAVLRSEESAQWEIPWS